MKEDTARDRKVQKQPMHFSLAQNNIKCLHSCSKVWLWLSTKVCAANFHHCIFVPLIPCLAVSVDPQRSSATSEIAHVGYRYAVQGRSRSLMLVSIENLYTTSY